MKIISGILILVLLPILFIYPKNFRKDLVNKEKAYFENMNKLSRIEYPGDSNIDIVLL